MNTPILAIRHLTVAYTQEPILADVSFVVEKPSCLAIIGPNGGGKSSLLHTIVGLLKPLAGTISVWGKSFQQQQHAVAYIPQRASIDWHFPLRVLDVVIMGCYGRLAWFERPGKHEYHKAYTVLEQIGLTDYAQTPIHALSGGQQQRVLIGRALMQQAALYIMDEPFIGVDMATEHMVITLCKQLVNSGSTIVMVHHDLQTVYDYFDTVLLLNRKVIAYGAVKDILMPEYICAAYGKQNLYVPRVRTGQL